MIEAYPLHWPAGHPRTAYPKPSQFATTLASARDGAVREISLLGGRNIIISTNVPVMRNGLPYGNYSRITDHGAAIYFTLNDQQYVFACDRWQKVEDNLQAIRKNIEAIRGMARWGVSDMLNRVFSGFKALPEQTAAEKDIWEILGLKQQPGVVEAVHSHYKMRVKEVHPDRPSGSVEAFQELQEAYHKALKFFN